MTQTELYDQLRLMADEKYRSFNEGLIPGVRKTFGVPVPKLRALAKEMAKGDWQEFLPLLSDDSQEELLLQGMILAKAPLSPDEQLARIADYVPKIDNWALCDLFCGDWKLAKKDPARVFPFVLPYLQSARPFDRRFGVVMLLAHFMRPDYIDAVLAELVAVDSEEYYVAMATAWALSVAFIKFPDKTRPLLQAKTLPADVQNKAIQKIRDSRRVSPQDKDLVAQWRLPKSN